MQEAYFTGDVVRRQVQNHQVWEVIGEIR
jgi:hypothetical protein